MYKEYKTRYFNKIEYVEDKHLLIKSSTNINKIISEYKYYYNLPHHIQRYFVQPFNLETRSESASYCVEKFFMKDLAFQFVYNTITNISFKNLFDRISIFQEESPKKILSQPIIDKNFEKEILYKCFNRIDILMKDERWLSSKYKFLIEEVNINLYNLIDRLKKAYDKYSLNRKTFNKILSHGDLCFSNILWSNDMNIIKFIDPKGFEDMYLDEYYDIAKLSHSLLGNYDQIVYENYYLDLKNINIDFYQDQNKYFINIFKNYLQKKDIDYNLLRVYEASIFVSMLPNHIEDDKRIAAFIINCNNILNELGF
jgi:hypothetical protein